MTIPSPGLPRQPKQRNVQQQSFDFGAVLLPVYLLLILVCLLGREPHLVPPVEDGGGGVVAALVEGAGIEVEALPANTHIGI